MTHYIRPAQHYHHFRQLKLMCNHKQSGHMWDLMFSRSICHSLILLSTEISCTLSFAFVYDHSKMWDHVWNDQLKHNYYCMCEACHTNLLWRNQLMLWRIEYCHLKFLTKINDVRNFETFARNQIRIWLAMTKGLKGVSVFCRFQTASYCHWTKI